MNFPTIDEAAAAYVPTIITRDALAATVDVFAHTDKAVRRVEELVSAHLLPETALRVVQAAARAGVRGASATQLGYRAELTMEEQLTVSLLFAIGLLSLAPEGSRTIIAGVREAACGTT